MRLKTMREEYFQDFKLPSMFIGTVSCNGKCCIESHIPFSVCQNDEWHSRATIVVDDDKLIQDYLGNSITQAIVFGGLEPMEQYGEVFQFINKLRNQYHCEDTVVIYTGYYENEIEAQLSELKQFKNIVVKFGRFIPNQPKHYDKVLGVYLAGDNQYAVQIS